MIEKKWELSNGNILIWLGNQSIHGCSNVLILSSGDVIFLKNEREEVGTQLKTDIEAMDKAAFFIKYHWPNNSSGDDLYWELKRLLVGVNYFCRLTTISLTSAVVNLE
jgi:hypothetical protein